MYSVDKQKQLKDFAEAVAVPVGLTDSAKWPVRAGTVIFPVRNILVREFLEQVEASGILGYPDKWRAAFDGPTQLWRTSHHLLNGLMDDGFDKSVIASKILVLIEGIAALNNRGHAVYALHNGGIKIREATAGPGDNLSYNSRDRTASGAWDN